MVFYQPEGDISDLENFKIKVLEFHLLDIGTAAYTEFDLNANIIDVYLDRPHLEEAQWGYMHSHHSMNAFFSGTDSSNLHESAEFFNYYFSLIVNHSGQYCAKVSMRGTTESIIKQVKTYRRNDGSTYTKVVDSTTTEDCVYVYDCDITWEGDFELDNTLLDKVRFDKAEKLRLNPPRLPMVGKKESIDINDWNQRRATKYAPSVKRHDDFEEDDFRALAKKMDDKDMVTILTEDLFDDEEVEPIPTNYLELIIESIVGIPLVDPTFREQVRGLDALTEEFKESVVENTADVLSEILQPFYELKKDMVRAEKQKLITDLQEKLFGYNVPPVFYEILKEAFKQEFTF